MLDDRVAYGVHCTWWDDIRKAGKTKPGLSGHSLPCCPHCGGLLYEIDTEREWFAGVDKFEARGDPNYHSNYRKMVEWSRGKCFKGLLTMKAAYDALGQGAATPSDR